MPWTNVQNTDDWLLMSNCQRSKIAIVGEYNSSCRKGELKNCFIGTANESRFNRRNQIKILVSQVSDDIWMNVFVGKEGIFS